MAFEEFNPGELNKSIKIVKFTSTETVNARGFAESGEVVETVVRSCRAKVSDESGTKSLESGSEFKTAKRRFLVRYTKTEITTDMLVRYRGELYSIVRQPNTYGDSGRFIEIWTERKTH